MSSTPDPVLTWEHFPGVVEAGRRDAAAGVALGACPHDIGTPKHLAWIKGYCPQVRADQATHANK